jgi:23S rRNA pseudouridine2605 synthase
MVKVRVQRILAQSGIAARRKCEELIKDGRVRVNGVVCKLGDSADPQKDTVSVDDEAVKAKNFVYLMLNKPARYITTSSDMFDRKIVLDLLPEKYVEERVFAIGRLDRDAEGLLLLTNDGDFANKIMHPRYEVPKTYRVWLNAPLQKEDIAHIKRGVELDDGWVKKMQIKPLDYQTVDLTLHVGKHKVVKRIFAYFGYRVTRLVRTKVGIFELRNLKPGLFKEIPKDMIAKQLAMLK